MKITDDLFKSYLSCQYKAHLKLSGEMGNKTELGKLNDEFRKALEMEITQQFIKGYYPVDILQTPLLKISDLKKGKKIILTSHIEIENSSCTSFFALEKIPKPSNLGSFSYVPITLSVTKKITKEIRLLFTFQAVCLSKLQGNKPQFGKIICRGSKRRSTIKFDPYYHEVQKVIQAIKKQHTNKIIPKFMLNKHCEMCQFKDLCHQKAIMEDDLSLLSGMSAREIKHQNNKGIFTINQYSYTFRARRKRKRVKAQKTPHFSALKALAIREEKIYIYHRFSRNEKSISIKRLKL